ncbi:MAG TPA: isoprenylcysteine carboxylmethyltransferase family protein [Azospirillaceae bacterium]|nr:isoprenylcysteine carboxylmethyltransferase family protein [Azospirillaceae bacterium]
MIGTPQVIVLLVALQRLGELHVARRNTRRLLAAGGHEVGAGHYPVIVGLHVAWLAALFLFTAHDAPVRWPLLGLFALLQMARLWIIATLGTLWTTRVIVAPGASLIRRGPYRFLRHPNYLVVTAEIAVLPLAFGQESAAVLFTVANLLILRHRIRIEEEANTSRAYGS